MIELTAELITSTWSPDDVRLSPDGRRVAWSASPYGKAEEHGESTIWVASVGGSEPARRWTYGGNNRTALLILHGERDIRVPAGQATAFHRALRRGATPVDLVVYPREPHGIAEQIHQRDALRRVREWYARWLPLTDG